VAAELRQWIPENNQSLQHCLLSFFFFLSFFLSFFFFDYFCILFFLLTITLLIHKEVTRIYQDVIFFLWCGVM